MALFGLVPDDVWDDAKQNIDDQINAYIKTGVPALQSAVEKEAINWLTKQNEATQGRLDDAIKEQLEAPSSDFGKALAGTLQNSIFKEYGMHIALGIAGVAVVGYLLLKKG